MKIINLDGRRNVSGERVRQMRTKKRMTQADLAARVQTTGVILEQDAISRIESGSRMVQDYELRALAEVLGVNRSALSRELGRMQREGLLEFYRSSFRLKNV